jgi:TetR/AcrR family transcriptional regulator, cholesterol catabolism regulator
MRRTATTERERAQDGNLTEHRILDVATKLFYERGYHGTTMREIAAGVGIKAGSLYNHFPGKQDILLRIGQEATRPLYEGAVAKLAEFDDVEDQLRELLAWHVAYHCEHGHSCRVIDTQLHALDAENRAAIVELRDEYERLLRDVLARGQREGRWEVEEMRVIAIGIATMCTEVDAWYRPGGRLQPDELGQIFAAFIRRGLGKPRSAPKPSGAGKRRSRSATRKDLS